VAVYVSCQDRRQSTLPAVVGHGVIHQVGPSTRLNLIEGQAMQPSFVIATVIVFSVSLFVPEAPKAMVLEAAVFRRVTIIVCKGVAEERLSLRSAVAECVRDDASKAQVVAQAIRI
jgi:hypothetical protein